MGIALAIICGNIPRYRENVKPDKEKWLFENVVWLYWLSLRIP